VKLPLEWPVRSTGDRLVVAGRLRSPTTYIGDFHSAKVAFG
jgi:hypothetical protein